LEEILYATALLWSGDLRYTATLFLWTDRLHCVFPYSDMPEVEYDWEMNKLTIDKENWENYLQN
jgi:hypothetical protein